MSLLHSAHIKTQGPYAYIKDTINHLPTLLADPIEKFLLHPQKASCHG